jgi:hypothetical protein
LLYGQKPGLFKKHPSADTPRKPGTAVLVRRRGHKEVLLARVSGHLAALAARVHGDADGRTALRGGVD